MFCLLVESLYVQRLSLTPAGWNTSSCLSQWKRFSFISQVLACWDPSPLPSAQRVMQCPVTHFSATCPRFLLWALFPPMLILRAGVPQLLLHVLGSPLSLTLYLPGLWVQIGDRVI